MMYEHWTGGDVGSTFIPADHEQKDFLTRGSVKAWEVEANSWDEAMALYHEHMGWEPYVPWDSQDEAL